LEQVQKAPGGTFFSSITIRHFRGQAAMKISEQKPAALLAEKGEPESAYLIS